MTFSTFSCLGLTWRRWFFSYSDLDATVPRFSGARLLFAKLMDVVYLYSLLTWLPGFLGVDMMLTGLSLINPSDYFTFLERRDISSTFVKQQEMAGRRVCAWTVNDLHEMKWMRNVLNIPILTDVSGLCGQI